MNSDRLTKADTVSLWHAVQWMQHSVSAMVDAMPRVSAEQVEAERARLKNAKRALRKVNALRKSQP